MTAVGDVAATDWTYRDARRRLVHAGRRHLQRHTAASGLDEAVNPIVVCSCGWTGNPLGWAGHLDGVVRSSLDAGSRSSVQQD